MELFVHVRMLICIEPAVQKRGERPVPEQLVARCLRALGLLQPVP